MARNTQVSADANAPPITRTLARFVATHPSRGWSDAVEQEAQIREYLARGGELRDLMDDAGLPDPGDLLPPGPRSRLGIQFREEPGTQRAVVQRVLPQYRADKMKMRVGDVVVSVNGAPIVFASLIETVVKAKRPYVIEVLRHGALVRLTEPKN